MPKKKAAIREAAGTWVDVYQRAVALEAVALRAGADGDTETRRALEREATATYMVGLRMRGEPAEPPSSSQLIAGVSAFRASVGWFDPKRPRRGG